MAAASTQNLAVIILAAGSSSRLGKPKQLLYYQQETLIKRVVKTALQLTAEVFVVSGFLHQQLADELRGFPVRVIHNPDWQEGMGSSIKAGMEAVIQSEKADEIDGVLFLLSDQPLISLNFLQELIRQFYAGKNSIIAATAYSGTQGVPAVFGKILFPDLQQLLGKGGAGLLFKKYQKNMVTVPFEAAAVDIDTEEDYRRLISSEKSQPE